MASVREQRLETDYRRLQALVAKSQGSITIEFAEGSPPDRYIINLRGRGVEKLDANERPVLRSEHRVRIYMPPRYPLDRVRVKMLTPIFHPHVWPTSEVCIGSDLLPGETLDILVKRLLALVKFDPRYFDFQSVAHQKAATWAQKNLTIFPFDEVEEPFKPAPPPIDDKPKPLFWRDTGPKVDWKEV